MQVSKQDIGVTNKACLLISRNMVIGPISTSSVCHFFNWN